MRATCNKTETTVELRERRRMRWSRPRNMVLPRGGTSEARPRTGSGCGRDCGSGKVSRSAGATEERLYGYSSRARPRDESAEPLEREAGPCSFNIKFPIIFTFGPANVRAGPPLFL